MVKLTKNELKKQKDALKRFNRYLPTLQLKQSQLQIVLRNIEAQQHELKRRLNRFEMELEAWSAVFSDSSNPIEMASQLRIKEFRSDTTNIAGIDIPVYLEPKFEIPNYSLYETSPWIDKGISALQEYIGMNLEQDILKEQYQRIAQELKITTQRVNLFEKVKIPESKDIIRVIQIYLGDQQTAAVVRGKKAKAKVQ